MRNSNLAVIYAIQYSKGGRGHPTPGPGPSRLGPGLESMRWVGTTSLCKAWTEWNLNQLGVRLGDRVELNRLGAKLETDSESDSEL